MQSAQTQSKFRGVGRYAKSLLSALINNKQNHEIIIVLNALYRETIDEIYNEFSETLAKNNIKVWNPLVSASISNIKSCNNTFDFQREKFFKSLKPDFILIMNLFEGFDIKDQGVVSTSIGLFDKETPVAVLLHDLIPLISPSIDFMEDQSAQALLKNKLEYLSRAQLLLTVSENSRQDALSFLKFPKEKVINISAGYDLFFKKLKVDKLAMIKIYKKFRIKSDFVLYVGAADAHKNLKQLIKSFALSLNILTKEYQLIMVGPMSDFQIHELIVVAKKYRLDTSQIIFTGFISNQDLLYLYNLCKLFILPSSYEGFGLPVLEAMACGAPVIVSKNSSLIEIVKNEEAMFDQTSVTSISSKISQALMDEKFVNQLINFQKEQIKLFSWEHTANKLLDSLVKFKYGNKFF
jgi:glycosyltransferase involved in cell wall biosynthesis